MKVVTRRHLFGATGEDCAMDRRTDAANSVSAAVVVVAQGTGDGKVNTFCVRCKRGLPNNGKCNVARAFEGACTTDATDATAVSYSVGDGIRIGGIFKCDME